MEPDVGDIDREFVAFAEFADVVDLVAAGFFALVLLVTVLRAERSVANGALTVITLLAIGVRRHHDDACLRWRERPIR